MVGTASDQMLSAMLCLHNCYDNTCQQKRRQSVCLCETHLSSDSSPLKHICGSALACGHWTHLKMATAMTDLDLDLDEVLSGLIDGKLHPYWSTARRQRVRDPPSGRPAAHTREHSQ